MNNKTHYNYMRLKERIITMYGTYKHFAEAVGTTASKVYNRLSNKTQFTAEDIRNWNKALNIADTEAVYYYFDAYTN